jgi:hypothetical protein
LECNIRHKIKEDTPDCICALCPQEYMYSCRAYSMSHTKQEYDQRHKNPYCLCDDKSFTIPRIFHHWAYMKIKKETNGGSVTFDIDCMCDDGFEIYFNNQIKEVHYCNIHPWGTHSPFYGNRTYLNDEESKKVEVDIKPYFKYFKLKIRYMKEFELIINLPNTVNEVRRKL